MKREEAMTDPMDRIIRETLAGELQPRLSAGFTAGVMDRIERRERKRELVRGAGIVLGVYWAAVLAFSGFLLAGVKWPAWFPLSLVALTPCIFLAALAPRRLFLRLTRALNLSPR
jgi:hypothetical protein